MNGDRRRDLATKFLVCTHTLKNLLGRINSLEADPTLTVADKHEKIKIIRTELTKVGTEIDNIKKEIKLLSDYRMN